MRQLQIKSLLVHKTSSLHPQLFILCLTKQCHGVTLVKEVVIRFYIKNLTQRENKFCNTMLHFCQLQRLKRTDRIFCDWTIRLALFFKVFFKFQPKITGIGKKWSIKYWFSEFSTRKGDLVFWHPLTIPHPGYSTGSTSTAEI